MSISNYSDQFTLKGASLFLVWQGLNYRVTKDADLLGSGNSDVATMKRVFKKILEIDCSDEDGIVYLTNTLNVNTIKEEEEYSGVRITLFANLHTARIPVQIDIGFGDIVIPKAEKIIFPALLDAPAPHVKAYS